jgi:hypothetical protein
MTTQTFSVEEYAAAVLGPGPDPDDPVGSVEPHKIQWLTKRLRGAASPQLPGFKAANKWRATQADVDEAIELLRPKRVALPSVPRSSGMTRTSRRRMAAL